MKEKERRGREYPGAVVVQVQDAVVAVGAVRRPQRPVHVACRAVSAETTRASRYVFGEQRYESTLLMPLKMHADRIPNEWIRTVAQYDLMGTGKGMITEQNKRKPGSLTCRIKRPQSAAVQGGWVGWAGGRLERPWSAVDDKFVGDGKQARVAPVAQLRPRQDARI